MRLPQINTTVKTAAMLAVAASALGLSGCASGKPGIRIQREQPETIQLGSSPNDSATFLQYSIRPGTTK